MGREAFNDECIGDGHIKQKPKNKPPPLLAGTAGRIVGPELVAEVNSTHVAVVSMNWSGDVDVFEVGRCLSAPLYRDIFTGVAIG